MKLAGQPTRFPDRAGGPAARMAAFAAHLRDTGIKIGVGQTGTALRALAAERGIGANLATFNRSYAKGLVGGRSVVMILSDGFDLDPAAQIGDELARLKKRGCRVIRLKPLKGWQGYAPVAAGIAATSPHPDLFAAANTLESLAALEAEFSRL